MGETEDGYTEADDVRSRSQEDSGSAESTVGEGEEGGVKDQSAGCVAKPVGT